MGIAGAVTAQAKITKHTFAKYNGHYYQVYDRGDMNWKEAVAFCKERGGYLASITSAAEDRFAYKLITENGYTSVLFGLTDQKKEGVWKWQNGEAFSYSNWADEEPNGGTDENYGTYYSAYSDGKWNDCRFDVEGILCEWNKAPDAAKEFKYKGHRYQLFHGAASWKEARKYCESKGGYLYIPDNAAENKKVYQYMRATGTKSAYFGIWDPKKNGNWITVKNKKPKYFNWANGEPNDDEEPYAMYYWAFPDGTWNDGAFSDYTLEGGSSFLCEWGSDSSEKKESSEGSIKQLGKPCTKNKVISVKYDDGKTISCETTYNDSFFYKDAKSENKKLAMLSVLAAASTYQDSKSPNYTAEMLKKCGFVTDEGFRFSKNGSVNGHSSKSDYDHARVQLGYKTITDNNNRTYLLVAAIINGYTQGHFEWVSNFNVGSGKDHAGFYNAASEILSLLNKRVKEYQKKAGSIDKPLPVKYWVTGHSRGGALTNIVAETLSGSWTSHVFAYGFATPRYSRQAKKYYKNIKNYINNADIVPMVAPVKWGFSRNYILRDNTILTTSKFKKVFRSLCGEKYGGSSKKSAEKLVGRMVSIASSQKEYNKKIVYKIGKKKFSFSKGDLVRFVVRVAMTDEKEGNKQEKRLISVEEKALKTVMEEFKEYVIADNHRVTAYVAGVSVM